MVDWVLRDEIDFDPYDDAIDIATRKLLGKIVTQREAVLAALPVGARLCVHDEPVTSSEGFDFRSEVVKYTVRQRAHTLTSGEQCGYAGTRAEYTPKPAGPGPCAGCGIQPCEDGQCACPKAADPESTITANVLKARLPVADGLCPDCGKPAAYAETPYIRVHHDANFQLDEAVHDACPAVITAREAAASIAASFDRTIFDAIDSYVGEMAELTGVPAALLAPADGQTPGVTTTAQTQWAAGDDEPPEALYDRLHEMFKRVSTPPPRPPVSPDTVRRSQEAAGMPRAPWIAIKASLDEPDATAFWMQPEPAADAYAVNAGIAPALWGVPLYRTGTYLARPVAEGGGWDVAEVMVTR
jgi:hypothetical protein